MFWSYWSEKWKIKQSGKDLTEGFANPFTYQQSCLQGYMLHKLSLCFIKITFSWTSAVKCASVTRLSIRDLLWPSTFFIPVHRTHHHYPSCSGGRPATPPMPPFCSVKCWCLMPGEKHLHRLTAGGELFSRLGSASSPQHATSPAVLHASPLGSVI